MFKLFNKNLTFCIIFHFTFCSEGNKALIDYRKNDREYIILRIVPVQTTIKYLG